ncbi:MAG: UDP-3-O-[3-hydroxymyristoyl] N-acetylglucosamine deacetylase [Alphaproteobacteria bacterium]|jgi:UDP-3-O-[3-hydroxymyristoyl] N-acetylglucosamine deacetylase|nr:UDP-3-O-[3-hydroxymyristoyl] N-acetylglucosamine deacetylase [Alphaproteobacteria bacterium]
MFINQPYQTTLSKSVSRSGIGLHSARLVDMTLHPAPADTGIIFRRVDVSSVDCEIPALSCNIADTMLNSRIMNDDGVTVGTVEHLLAAFAGLGVDNAYIDINAAELPAMDGSSLPYCNLIHEAGINILKTPRQYLKVIKPVRIETERSWAEITPSERLEIDVSIAFEDDFIGQSQYFYVHDDTSFEDELAAARTFCLYPDLTKLRAAGYALGGSLDNAIVVDQGKILNDDGLRYTDEFVRHKTLDCLGDLYLAGHHVLGHITASQPGHAINNRLLEALLNDESAWVFVNGLEKAENQVSTKPVRQVAAYA